MTPGPAQAAEKGKRSVQGGREGGRQSGAAGQRLRKGRTLWALAWPEARGLAGSPPARAPHHSLSSTADVPPRLERL